MGPSRMNLPPQQTSHQSNVNTPSLHHNYNQQPLHHTSQSNPPMLPQSMQPHLSPSTDLQSTSARTTRPQLTQTSMVVHDAVSASRQLISSTSTAAIPQMLTQGVQQL